MGCRLDDVATEEFEPPDTQFVGRCGGEGIQHGHDPLAASPGGGLLLQGLRGRPLSASASTL